MEQQREPLMKLTSKNRRTLPILDYYLTFIHCFGFGINPDDDHRSRYLSIRVKRVPTLAAAGTRATAAASAAAAAARAANTSSSTFINPEEVADKQWLAKYTHRAQRRLHSLPFPLFAYLKTTMKYMAITFNTFIAANHCVVLVDYICSGSRGIEDIILDIRLVITKLSALIFVLSWHHKRSEVRQLIKLVKSTSLYILATHGQQLQRQLKLDSYGKNGATGQPLLAPESPIPSPTVAANTTAAAYPPPTKTLLGRQQQQQHKVKPTQDEAAATNPNENISDEIGSSLKLDTSAFDRRILKGWFVCLLLIIVHFSLSEAEISKSYHLWQWLDDYSLHQLGNQSISYETLMFLATFDNYIYTVHVYGTRLIGASIICIVCSLQHEVIKSLNLYTLRLIRRSQQPLLRGLTAPPGGRRANQLKFGGGGASRNCREHQEDPDDNQMGVRQRQLQRQHRDDPDITSVSSSSSGASLSGGSRTLLLGGKRSAPTAARLDRNLDSSMFFVLGESDWFRVRAHRDQLEPCGHITGTLWQTCCLLRGWLRVLLAMGVGLARKVRPCSRLLICRMVGRRWPWQTRALPSAPPRVVGRKRLGFAADSRSGCWRQQPRIGRVTPRMNDENNNSGQTTRLGELASSLIIAAGANGAAGGLDRSRPSASRPTPLTLAPAALLPRAYGKHPSPLSLGSSAHYSANAMHAIGAAASRLEWLARAASPTTAAKRSRASLVFAAAGGLTSANTALCWSNPLRSSDEYQARLMAMASRHRRLPNQSPTTRVFLSSPASASNRHDDNSPNSMAMGARRIELQMERLSTKYELVRTVNARINACFGPMLLIQFSFLFIMSCIDLVFFSLCFSPNTKTKYIIISGMILLWCPYMLIYKFASDMGSSSSELLVSIRRLARLYLLEDQAHLASMKRGRNPLAQAKEQHLWSAFRVESTNRFLYNNQLLVSRKTKQRPCRPPPTMDRYEPATGTTFGANCGGTKIGAGIVDKLDHIFKPTHLSIMGIMTVDKFFLLNFAKIVITSSVMMIQFISS